MPLSSYTQAPLTAQLDAAMAFGRRSRRPSATVQGSGPYHHPCCVLGLKVGSLATATDLRSLPTALAEVFSTHKVAVSGICCFGASPSPSLISITHDDVFPRTLASPRHSRSHPVHPQGARVVRHLMISQVQADWQDNGVPGPHQEAPGERSSGDRDLLLRPLDCVLRLAMGPQPSSASSASSACPLEVLLGTQSLELQVRPALSIQPCVRHWSRCFNPPVLLELT